MKGLKKIRQVLYKMILNCLGTYPPFSSWQPDQQQGSNPRARDWGGAGPAEGQDLTNLLSEWKELGGYTWDWIKMLYQGRWNGKLGRQAFTDTVTQTGLNVLAKNLRRLC